MKGTLLEASLKTGPYCNIAVKCPLGKDIAVKAYSLYK